MPSLLPAGRAGSGVLSLWWGLGLLAWREGYGGTKIILIDSLQNTCILHVVDSQGICSIRSCDLHMCLTRSAFIRNAQYQSFFFIYRV